MKERQYEKTAGLATKNPGFLMPIAKKPATLTSRARFGFGFRLTGRTARSFVVDGGEDSGFVLYLDRNADGDLTNDAPLRFEKTGGVDRLEFREDVVQPGLPGESHVAQWRVSLATIEGQRVLLELGNTFRAGSVDLDGTAVRFILDGQTGIYNTMFNAVYFDANGDGTVDVSANSDEKYEIPERIVNLAGRSYEFTVDRYGDRLTLQPLDEKRPDHALLGPGHPAPDFSATNTEGREESLSKYRGKVVVLDFWGMSCGPCVEELPKLAESYSKYHERGLEVIGIHYGDDVKALLKFTKRHKLTWSQVAEKGQGPLNRMYRVHGFPRYFLIDRDGSIIANDARPSDRLPELIEKAVLGGP